jgi:putative ABC transport system substrate-binding protein
MRRRDFITGIVGSTVWPLAAPAQQQPQIAHIGFLGLGPAAAQSNRVKALRAGLRDLGYVEGKNIVIEFRWAETVEQLPKLALRTAASPDLIPANPLACSSSVRFPVDEIADARDSRCRHLRGQHDDHEIR